MICPRCGSSRVVTQAATETTTSGRTKGFGWIKACFGYLIMGPIGILCGLCGMGKGRTSVTSRTRVIHICQDCGNRF